MKRTKAQKGITLVALIITIVVLLILAGVAISSIQEGGIIQYARNAKGEYGNAQTNEQEILDSLPGYIYNAINGGQKPSTDTVVDGLQAPTAITWVDISGKNLTIKATGGNGTGYQYSADGISWSETVANGQNCTLQNLFTSGTNWTIYARTANTEGVSANNIQQKIISFKYYPWMVQGELEFYVPDGTSWETFINKDYANQIEKSPIYFGTDDFSWGNENLGWLVVETGNRILFNNKYVEPSAIIQENGEYIGGSYS